MAVSAVAATRGQPLQMLSQNTQATIAKGDYHFQDQLKAITSKLLQLKRMEAIRKQEVFLGVQRENKRVKWDLEALERLHLAVMVKISDRKIADLA